MLEWSSGVQAATMTAMRTSAENAKNLKAELELTLNRRRCKRYSGLPKQPISKTITKQTKPKRVKCQEAKGIVVE